MKMMLVGYTRFAEYFNRVIGKIIASGGNVSDKIGVSIDPSYARVSVGTLAFMPRSLKNLLFHSIIKCSDYPYHTNTSNLVAVMIDANYRLAYPLGQTLEGRANGNICCGVSN
jgi:hypothetical protein